MRLRHEPFQAVPIQPLVDELRVTAGPDGRTLRSDDPEYVGRMLEALNRASYPPVPAPGTRPRGYTSNRQPVFGVVSIATAGGAVRFAYVCRGCGARALVLFVESPGVLRCRRCVGLRYDRSAGESAARAAKRDERETLNWIRATGAALRRAALAAKRDERKKLAYIRRGVRLARRLGRHVPDDIRRSLDGDSGPSESARAVFRDWTPA